MGYLRSTISRDICYQMFMLDPPHAMVYLPLGMSCDSCYQTRMLDLSHAMGYWLLNMPRDICYPMFIWMYPMPWHIYLWVCHGIVVIKCAWWIYPRTWDIYFGVCHGIFVIEFACWIYPMPWVDRMQHKRTLQCTDQEQNTRAHTAVWGLVLR